MGGRMTDNRFYVFTLESLDDALQTAQDLMINDISVIKKLAAVAPLTMITKISGTFSTGDPIEINDSNYLIKFLDWNYMFFNQEHLPAILVVPCLSAPPV